jgi:hypothetical protein
MKSWWIGVAVVVAWPACAAAQAFPPQALMPTPYGAARCPCPEPMPCGPDLVPGPLTPQQAPPGPPPCLDLPENHASAFQCEQFEPDCGVYVHLGAIGLMREKFGHQPLAVADPQNLDTGVVPPAGQPLLFDTSFLPHNLQYGYKLTVGAQFENCSVEVGGFFMSNRETLTGLIAPGRIDVLATNAPFGFEGDNGLFLQDDRVILFRDTQLGSGELNFRYCDKAVTSAELILGVRYLDLRERLDFLVDDDGVTFPLANNLPNPNLVANYRVSTKNRIIGPQCGFEYGGLVWPGFLSLGMTAKGAWGVNFIEYGNELTRGAPGFVGNGVGFGQSSDQVKFSQIYELGAFAEFHLLERARIRAGYQIIWLLDIANVQDNMDLNLANHEGPRKSNGSLYFHGPSLEFQWLF